MVLWGIMWLPSFSCYLSARRLAFADSRSLCSALVCLLVTGIAGATAGLASRCASGRIVTRYLAVPDRRPVLCCRSSKLQASCAICALDWMISHHNLLVPASTRGSLEITMMLMLLRFVFRPSGMDYIGGSGLCYVPMILTDGGNMVSVF